MKSSEFLSFVPHRPPMIWIDEVVSASSERGECRVFLKPDALYREDGHVLPTSCVEWVAQTFAFVRSAYLIEAGQQGKDQKPHEALLVGIRNAKFMFEIGDPEVDNAEEVLIIVDHFREFGPIIMVQGEVRLASGRVLMQGSLRLYHGFSA